MNSNSTRFGTWLLVVSAIGLMPIALSYGTDPSSWIPRLFGIDAQPVNARHIFRAVMGLYFGMIVLWLLGAFRPSLRQAALISLITFMYGLAAGRLVSFILDGLPTSPLLIVYFILEASIGITGQVYYRRCYSKF